MIMMANFQQFLVNYQTEAKPSKQTISNQNTGVLNSNGHDPCKRYNVLELLMPACLKAENKKKKKKRAQDSFELNERGKKKLTLQDVLATPSLKEDSFSEGELYLLKHTSAELHPSSTCETTSFKGSESFSLERLVMLDRARAIDEHYSSVSSTTTSSIKKGHTRSIKKKVRFKLPEETDVVLYYSHITK